jgi:hypothetical protein
MTDMVSSAKNMVGSAVNTVVNKVHNPEAIETYEFEYKHIENFNETIAKYIRKFDEENLKKNNIVSCEITKKEKNEDIEITQRHIVFDLLKLPFVTIPESVLYYFPDTKITIEHNIELDMINKTMRIEMINITNPQLKFSESSSFEYIDNKTIYKLKATLSANILFGINETVRKIWHLQYKMYYDDYENKFNKNN